MGMRGAAGAARQLAAVGRHARAARGRRTARVAGGGPRAAASVALVVCAATGTDTVSAQEPAPAAGAMLGLHADVVVDAGNRASVRLEVRLGTGADGAVPFRIVAPPGLDVVGVTAARGASAMGPVDLATRSGGPDGSAARVAGASGVRVLWGEGPAAPPGAASGREAPSLRLSYEVVAAAGPVELDRFDLTVPLALVDRAPAGSPEGFFTAVVELPEGVALWETFPVSVGAPTGAMSLPVLPAFVRLRGGRGPPPRVTAPLVADVAVGVAIVLLSWVAWRRARGGGRRSS